MEARRASSRKRKSAALESAEELGPNPSVGERGEGVDCISSLPNDVLGEIISLLPTNEGARTQILAHRWGHLWCSAPLHLDLNHLGCRQHRELGAYVSRILSSHQGPSRHLNAWTDDDAMEECLCSPALDKLQELEVNFSFGPLGTPVPASFFCSSSLTLHVVDIESCSISDATIQGLHFSMLKQLGLTFVQIMSDCSFYNMIAGCLVLDCLMLYCCYGANCLWINSLSVRRIGVDNVFATDQIVLEQLIIESAPRLETLLHLDQNNDLHVSVLFAPKLENVGCCSNSTRIVFGFKDIQATHIDSLAIVACTVKRLDLSMLTLSLDMVVELLRRFQRLEKLCIQCRTAGKSNYWSPEHPNLIRCLDAHLKIVVLKCYQGKNSDIEFFTFFALNTRVLESMTLVVETNNEEFLAEQRQKLQLDNRASSGAQFHFTTDDSKRNYWDIRNVRDLYLVDP